MIAKRVISYIAYYLGLWRFTYFTHKLFTGKNILAVFTFHRITDKEKSKQFYMGYDRGLDKKIFEIQIKAICKYFDVINLDKYIDIVSGKEGLKRHSALLTFDDADSDFIDQALSVLTENNCSVTIFVPIGFIDTDESFWHLRISNIISEVTDEGWAQVQNDVSDFPKVLRDIVLSNMLINEQVRALVCRNLINALDKMDHVVIRNVIDKMESIIGSEYKLGIRCMGWDQLRSLVNLGHDMGSHSVTHRKLGELGMDENTYELQQSKTVMEEKLGCQIKAICYPAGSYNNDVIEIAAQAGYQVGFTTHPGSSSFPLIGLDTFKLSRYTIYGTNIYNIHSFLGMIAVKRMLKKP